MIQDIISINNSILSIFKKKKSVFQESLYIIKQQLNSKSIYCLPQYL